MKNDRTLPRSPCSLQKIYLIFLVFTFISHVILSYQYFGKSDFQGDQIDQLVRFTTLIKIPLMKAFYGPYMSETNPVVYNFGPAFSALLGLLTKVGLNPDEIHILCNIFNHALSSVLFFLIFKFFNRKGYGLIVFIWSAILFSSDLYLQQVRQLWVNNFITLSSLLTFYFYLRAERRPDLNNVIVLVAFFFLGLHFHSTAIVGFTLVAFVIFRKFTQLKKNPKKLNPVTWFFLIAAIGPYLVAEWATDFGNSKAILANIFHNQLQIQNHFQGFRSAKKSLYQFVEVVGLFGGENSFKVFRQVTALIFLTMFILLIRKKIRKIALTLAEEFLFLSFTAVFAMTVFFLCLNHRIGGPHYFYYGLIFLTFPWAFLICFVLENLFNQKDHSARKLITILVCCSLIVLFGQFKTANMRNKMSYSYRDILETLTEICHIEKRFSIADQAPEFETFPDPDYKTTSLKYIMEGHKTGCLYDRNSESLLTLAMVEGNISNTIQNNGKAYVLKSKFEHGLSLYQSVHIP